DEDRWRQHRFRECGPGPNGLESRHERWRTFGSERGAPQRPPADRFCELSVPDAVGEADLPPEGSRERVGGGPADLLDPDALPSGLDQLGVRSATPRIYGDRGGGHGRG